MLKYYEFIKENNKNEYIEKIEFSLLDPYLNSDKIKELIDQALEKNIKIINTLPEHLSDVKIFTENKPVKLSVSIDFPRGNANFSEKKKEINEIIISSVNEIDYTINYKTLNKKEKDVKKLKEELLEISDLCHKNSIVLKIIIDINYLSLEQIKLLSQIATEVGIDYIQTSTGEKTDKNKVEFLRKILPSYIKIKVAGEITSINNMQEYKGIADRFASSRFII